MLKVTRAGSTVRIETGVARIEWDRARGGEITRFAVMDELTEHPLLPEGSTWPALAFDIDGLGRVCVADVPADVAFVRQQDGEIAFRATAVVADGAVRVEQLYEVFPEGAVFCELIVQVAPDHVRRIRSADMTMPVRVAACRRARWAYASRRLEGGRDATRLHAFFATRLFLRPSEAADEPELLPWVSLDLGWEPARLFSNHVEFLIEDNVPLLGGPSEATRTRVGADDGEWRLNWRLWSGGRPAGSCGRYVNRWGVIFGAARTGAGADVDRARRNNLLMARTAHMGIPYLRKSDAWPWRVMQMQQSPHFAPAYFCGMPPVETADKAARGGADTVIVHQGWMANPGTNNEPPADYRAADPDWLRAFVARCHDLGMRVALYMRGTEMHAMYSSFFEDFLQRDRDGLYVDWSSPLAMGWAKASPLHFSAYNYFHFTRALRERVGPLGTLEAHCGSLNTLLATTTFDVLLSGEAAGQRDALLSTPEACACFGMLGGVGPCLITGDRYERRGFMSGRATAFVAALGMCSKAGLGPSVPFDESSAHLQPLWRLLRRLSGPPRRIYSEVVGTAALTSQGDEDTFAVVVEATRGPRLLLVTHLGESPSAPVEVSLNADALGIPDRAALTPISPDPSCVRHAGNGILQLDGLASMGIVGVLVG